MNRLVAAICLFVAACAPQASKADDPSAPARIGKLICVLPVESEKLCNTITQLTFRADGSVSHHSDVLMGNLMGDRLRVVISTDYPVKLEGGAFCGSIGPAEVDAIKIVVDGAPAEPKQAAEIRAMMKANMTARNIQEGCVRPVSKDGDYLLTGEFDGVPQPGLKDRMIWIEPDEGYSVR